MNIYTRKINLKPKKLKNILQDKQLNLKVFYKVIKLQVLKKSDLLLKRIFINKT